MYIKLIPDTRCLKIVTAANFKKQTLWSLEANRIDTKKPTKLHQYSHNQNPLVLSRYTYTAAEGRWSYRMTEKNKNRFPCKKFWTILSTFWFSIDSVCSSVNMIQNSDCHHGEKRAPELLSDDGCSALILITYFFRVDVLLPLELMSRSSEASHKVKSSSS
jgi:hypothetical protein